MVERVDAERPMGADQPRLDPLQKLKAWPPHQRAIAKNPDICGVGGRVHLPFITTKRRICRNKAGMDKARVLEKDSSSETPYSPASSCAGTAEPADSGSEEHKRCANLDPPLAVGC